MDELEEMYNDLIMEHSMNSYNKKKLETCDLCEKGHNPNCGDEIEIELKLGGENKAIIEDMAFTGHGCAISQASTSIMIDTLKGKTIKKAKEIIEIFIEMIKRETKSEEELKKLEDAIAFKNISNMPARVKCALLAWHTVKESLDKMENKKVYFSKEISKENLVKMYETLNVKLPGKVAVKVHSGEDGNQNYLRAEFMEDIIKYVNGTIVECNTAYEGARNTTEKHKELMKKHKWSDLYNVDIMDADGEMELSIPEGKVIKVNYVGDHLKNYDSMLVISHFKGHPMGGFGGALKNISIGVASAHGKAYIHGAGKPEDLWTADHDSFLEAMADADKSIVDYFKGNIVFINIMCNMSVDCDCCAKAEDPCMKDIGILASTDPVALDQACIDLVYNSNDPGKDHLIERIESRNGIHTIEAANQIGVGSRGYELIEL